MWNLPNSLTFLRILMVPLLVVVLLTRFSGSEFWGLGIFLLAALTDLADGMIARRTKAVTVTGTLLDPIADKVMLVSSYLVLGFQEIIPFWVVGIVLLRDVVLMLGFLVLHLLS